MKYDNESLDGAVGFLEENHRYILKEDPDLRLSSVTGLIGNYHEEFNAQQQAARLEKHAKKSSPYYGMTKQEILDSWVEASEMGTALHAYGESLLQDLTHTPPSSPKAKHVPVIVEDLKLRGFTVAKTELLVYSVPLQLAGQSDIILKKSSDYYAIYDWKFLRSPIVKKSFYDYKSRKYKKMRKPFHYLDDCNWIHYSIQMALYQTLTGDPARIKEKVLVVVNDENWTYEPAYPMRVFWDENLQLQAVYETWNGKYYDSRVNRLLDKWPEDIAGR